MSSVTVLRLKFVIAACVIAGLIYWLSYLLLRDSAAVMANPPQPIRFSDSAAVMANPPQPIRFSDSAAAIANLPQPLHTELFDILHK